MAMERDSGSRDGLMFPASESQTQTGLKSDLSEESKGKGDLLLTVDGREFYDGGDQRSLTKPLS